MASAFGLLACWGMILFLIFGFIWMCSDNDDSYHRPMGYMSLGSILVAVIASVIREAIINW